MNFGQKPFTFISLLLILITTACEKQIDKTKPQNIGPLADIYYSAYDLTNNATYEICASNSTGEVSISPTEINSNWEGTFSYVDEYSVPQLGPFTMEVKNPYNHNECFKCQNEDSVKVRLSLANNLPINLRNGLEIRLNTKTKSDSSFQFFYHTLKTNLDSFQKFDTTFIVQNMPDITEAHLTLKNYHTDGANDAIDWWDYSNANIDFDIEFHGTQETEPIIIKQANCTTTDLRSLKVISKRMRKDKSYNGYLYFYVENSYPFNFEISTYTVDASGNVINELIDRQSPAKISAADIDPNTGAIQSTTEKKIEIRVTEQTAKNIINANNIVNELHFNTKDVKTDNDGNIRIPVSVYEPSLDGQNKPTLQLKVVEDLRAFQ